VHQLFQHLSAFFLSLGGFGLLLLGVLDSSILFLPLGNDLLVVALSAQHHERVFYYVAMAALGSTIGTWITWWLARKGGKEGLEKSVSPRRLKYVERQVEMRGAIALAVASLMPPPFPFTPFVMVAGVLNYPQVKLLSVVAFCRAIRFGILALLAVKFGKHILDLASRPAVQIGIVGLVILSIGGSAFSIYRWVKRSRTRS
jgi:membrane protein YqaA with SNARE-associated domain